MNNEYDLRLKYDFNRNNGTYNVLAGAMYRIMTVFQYANNKTVYVMLEGKAVDDICVKLKDLHLLFEQVN